MWSNGNSCNHGREHFITPGDILNNHWHLQSVNILFLNSLPFWTFQITLVQCTATVWNVCAMPRVLDHCDIRVIQQITTLILQLLCMQLFHWLYEGDCTEGGPTAQPVCPTVTCTQYKSPSPTLSTYKSTQLTHTQTLTTAYTPHLLPAQTNNCPNTTHAFSHSPSYLP